MHERSIRFFSIASCIIITVVLLMCFVKILMMPNASFSDVFHAGVFLGLLCVGFCLTHIGWETSRQYQAAPEFLRFSIGERALRVNGTAFAFIMMAMCLAMR